MGKFDLGGMSKYLIMMMMIMTLFSREVYLKPFSFLFSLACEILIRS